MTYRKKAENGALGLSGNSGSSDDVYSDAFPET